MRHFWFFLSMTIANLAFADASYELMKINFQASDFCVPENVFNYSKKPNPILVKKYISELSDKPAREKGLLIQEYLRNFRTQNDSKKFLSTELARLHIFKVNSQNEIECPFVSEDAFRMALNGRKMILKKDPTLIPNKNLLTIVDYTRPSNERRLFVIDLSLLKVIHNTWVAHGSGGGAGGVDGLGSSPKTSNVIGSNMSSEGFVLAVKKSHGELYGNNVILKGIDSDNSNMTSRSVVLHGWSSPAYEFMSGIDETRSAHKSILPGFDVSEKVKQINFQTTSLSEVEKVLRTLESSVTIRSFMEPTEGCLGVPIVNMKHLDARGRDKTQIELLREDLPGSLIFNYSGSQTKTKFRN